MRNAPRLMVGRAPSKRRAIWLILGAVTIGAMCAASVAAPSSRSEVLARSFALYPTLTSYADTATVVRESPSGIERWKFTTRFRAPLDFYFDFQGVDWKSGSSITLSTSYHRMVLWMIGGELQSFNLQMKSHETIPRASGRQVAHVQGAGAGTVGTSMLIPSLIFANANLPGALRQIQEATDAGFETVSGRRCHKIIGMAAEYYPSGQMTNVRKITVWIDAETLLVRKVFEDTPKGYPLGSYSRLTVTIEPQMNPKLDDGKFHFEVPTFQ
jgi:outer membrane lipoprotein-sorting protein